MKKYYKGWISLPLEHFVPAVTEKAIMVTVAGGVSTSNDKHEWFPKSQIVFGEPNECNNVEVYIPVWLFRSKRIDPRRIRELNLDGEVVEL